MAFRRPASAFRNALGSEEFPFEPGRYLLYTALACPWACGALMVARFRKLVGTSPKSRLRLCVVHPTWQFTDPESDRRAWQETAQKEGLPAGAKAPRPHAGWVFCEPQRPLLPLAVMLHGGEFGLELPGSAEDICGGRASLDADAYGPVLEQHGVKSAASMADISGHKAKTLRHLYEIAGGYMSEGVRATTPMVFDAKADRVVSNDSLSMVKFLNEWGQSENLGGPDLYPAPLQQEIDRVVDWVYVINNGVYRCGFAASQPAYSEAAAELEARMLEVEAYLAEEGGREFLVGGRLTIADIRLFNTLVRMDEVYVVYFKCNFASLLSGNFPHLLRYAAALYNGYAEIRDCIDMDEIVNHYFTSHPSLNTYAVVPKRVGLLEKLQGMKPSEG